MSRRRRSPRARRGIGHPRTGALEGQPRPRGLGRLELRSLLSKVGHVSLPWQTIARWVSLGLLVPSVRKSAGSTAGHRWSAADVVLVIWIARLRDAGWDVVRLRRAMRTLWGSLTETLDRPDPQYLVLLADDAASAVSAEELPELLRSRPDAVTAVWPAISVERIRREAASMGIGDLV